MFSAFSPRKRDAYEVARRRMVQEQIVAKGVTSSRVLAAMNKVPRHEFVSKGMEAQAYTDRPLLVGLGQTISQPLIVAMMTEALNLTGNEKVLEIGTGSGYQAAILAELCKELYTIERLRDLSVRARIALYKLGYKNIKLKIGDGTLGWEENAPYDRIIVTAGAPCVPDALKNQLSDGGMLLIPVGGEDIQSLELITRHGDTFETKKLTGCRFVKLIGREGWKNGG